MIAPFANNAQSMQIGELIIEIQQDKISIYGDIDIYRDSQGLQDIKQLHQLTETILQALQTEQVLPLAEDKTSVRQQEKRSRNQIDDATDTVDNPFL